MAPAADTGQRLAARVLGLGYLLAMALGIFGESFVRGTLITGDALTTAQSILANKELFRAGIAAEILTFATDVTVITASYVILSPVHRYLALYAAFFRLVAVAVSVMMAAHSFDILRILSGAPYLRVFESDQLAALARLSLGSHGAAYLVAFVFLGLGSTVFATLWWRSSYVPRALSGLGIVGSASLAAGSLLVLVVPSWSFVDPWYMVPIFFFEVGMGLWLLVRGLPRRSLSSSAAGRRASA